MTVVAMDGATLTARVDQRMQGVVAATLEAHAAAIEDSLTIELVETERARRRRDLEQIARLRRQIGAGADAVLLRGRPTLVIEILRDAASQAGYQLESMLERCAATPARLSDDALAALREQADTVDACIDALIVCEASRRRA